MKYTSTSNGLPAGNPIANILVIIVGALAIGASIVLGFFAVVIVGSIVLIMAAIVGLRVWWFKRSLRGRNHGDNRQSSDPSRGVIEGEFSVIADNDKDE